MSQAKVDRYKEEKKNRKQVIAKEKRVHKIQKGVVYLCLIAVLGGVGYSAYLKMNPAPEADASAIYYLTQTDSYGLLQPSLPQAAE